MNGASAKDGGPASRVVPAIRFTRSLVSTSRLICAFCLICMLLPPVSSSGIVPQRDEMRDFPPVVDPQRPAGLPEERAPAAPRPVDAIPAVPEPGDHDAYRLGVGDEVQVLVLGHPDFSRTVIVRPDGAITAPGAGMVHALGRSPEEVAAEIEERLKAILRHPRVDLLVASFGEHRVFVMGEVEIPGGHPYHKGMSAMQAIAKAGGILSTGKSGSVVVLRRTGPDEAHFFQLSLGEMLKGPDRGEDMVLMPYDIVFVPKTFIANVNVFVDQYMRQMIAPFSLYVEGWNAFNIERRGVRVITAR